MRSTFALLSGRHAIAFEARTTWLTRCSRLIGSIVACVENWLMTSRAPFLRAASPSVVKRPQTNQAVELAAAVLRGWAHGVFEPLPDGFSAQMKAYWTIDEQQRAYRSMEKAMRVFESLEVTEIHAFPQVPGYTVLNCRASCQDMSVGSEVRLVMKTRGEIAAFYVVPIAESILQEGH